MKEAQFKALLGYHQSALSLLDSAQGDPKDMYFSVTKARIYLNLGMPEEAIKTFDELGIGGYNSVKEGMSDEDCYKLWITMQVMARAFLMNDEPKSAQVCINECKKVWEKLQGFVDKTELAEFEQTNANLQKKVEMEI